MLTRRQFQSKVCQLSLAARASSLSLQEPKFTPTWPSLKRIRCRPGFKTPSSASLYTGGFIPFQPGLRHPAN